MLLNRRAILTGTASLATAAAVRPARAASVLTVAFAGSMGVVMDKGLGPAFQAKTGTQYRGIGQPSMALAHLLAAKTLVADVFVPVSAGPAKIVEEAGLSSIATPVAATEMVLAYSPKSKFAEALAAAKGAAWTKILVSPGLRFGRTDSQVDPQGAYVLYALQLAALYYNQLSLATGITGAPDNPAQIFAEPSLLARLQDGEIDATIGYKSAVISQKLPYLTLPPEINFSTPSLAKDWYGKATLTLKGKVSHPSALVFYAMVMKNAADPIAAQGFVNLLTSAQGQAIFAEYGYNPVQGKPI